ncbi:MAG TPA: Error-prone repair protein ImuA [Bacteroidia bacterium]|jgi:protein ImuA|nr:Error-prone repair protein ImuA [Bacteroidia bacterium]
MKRAADKKVIEELQRQILKLQGNQPLADQTQSLGLGPVEQAFPGKVFPRAAVHELISNSTESASCTNGFLSVVLSALLQQTGSCLWISTRRTLFPPALKTFGIEPDRILFVDVPTVKKALWVMEEALKCKALTAVVGEFTALRFDESRRLQLAVEQSKVTGFVHRFQPKIENTVACTSRWKITSLVSTLPDDLPGVGFPRWNIDLLKVRNGKPASWQVQWSPQHGLTYIDASTSVVPEIYTRSTA